LFRRFTAKKNRVLSLVVVLAVPVFILAVSFRVLSKREATAQVLAKNAALQQQINQLEAENKAYLAVLQNDDPEALRDYVIRTAREKLGLSLPGDQVFIDRALFRTEQP
jgi:cell division protein FtsB